MHQKTSEIKQLSEIIIQNNPKIVTSYICLKRNIEAFIRSKYEYGIICDDDFYPIDYFFDEINIARLLKTNGANNEKKERECDPCQCGSFQQ